MNFSNTETSYFFFLEETFIFTFPQKTRELIELCSFILHIGGPFAGEWINSIWVCICGLCCFKIFRWFHQRWCILCSFGGFVNASMLFYSEIFVRVTHWHWFCHYTVHLIFSLVLLLGVTKGNYIWSKR